MRQQDTEMRKGVAAIGKEQWLVALRCFNHVLAGSPGHSGALANKAIALRGLGRAAEALDCLERVIAENPMEAILHYNKGTVLDDLGRLDAALESYRQALRLSPGHGKSHLNLASCLRRLGRLQEALASLELAARNGIPPATIHTNRGNILAARQDWSGAIGEYKLACEIDANLATAWEQLAVGYEQLGDAPASRHACTQAMALGQNNGLRLLSALSMSKLPDSSSQIMAERVRVVSELPSIKFHLDNPFGLPTTITAFASAYHGVDELPLRRAVAETYARVAPSLLWMAPKLGAKQPGRRLRLGVISEFLRPGHTIGRLYGQILSAMSRELFEIVVFLPPALKPDAIGRYAADAEKVVLLPDDLSKAREIIASERLDVLFYPDIGMGRFTYFLAFARLAPIQVCSYGHPVTSGSPNIDYFLSSSLIEPEAGEDHYCEKLVQLPCLPQAPRLPDIEGIGAITLSDLGVPEGHHLYLCAQTLFKLHPDFDDALVEILRRDAKGIGVFIRSPGTDWQKRFLHRIGAKAPEIVERIVFVGPFDHRRFLALLSRAHVNLDTFHFSGGYSSFEAFCVGTPVVTLPGEFMRSRVTAGYYRQMGVDGLEAASRQDYVEQALRLAGDADWRHHLGEQLKRNVQRVTDDRFIPALEEFLCRVGGRT